MDVDLVSGDKQIKYNIGSISYVDKGYIEYPGYPHYLYRYVINIS